jgi:hypothetical protein
MHFFLLTVYFMFTVTDKHIVCACVCECIFCIQDTYTSIFAPYSQSKFSHTLIHNGPLGAQELYKQGHVCIVFAVTHSI